MIHLKSLTRMMLADKRQHVINITGLTIGLTVLLLISLYLKTELSFDKHIQAHENKFRLLKKAKDERVAIFPYRAGEVFRTNLPEFKQLCMVDQEYGHFSIDNNPFKVENALVSDSSFISMFNLEIIEGIKQNLLNEPSTCIISQSTAQKFFGNASAIDKIIKHQYNGNLNVKAVFKDIPNASHLQADIVESRSTWRKIKWKKRYFNEWGNQGTNIYVSINSSASIDDMEQKITKVIFKESPWFGNVTDDEILSNFKIQMQPMQDIHLLSSDIQWDRSTVKKQSKYLKSIWFNYVPCYLNGIL